ncbi:MAG: sterol desaturase family protein [Actinomycetota bacterium]
MGLQYLAALTPALYLALMVIPNRVARILTLAAVAAGVAVFVDLRLAAGALAPLLLVLVLIRLAPLGWNDPENRRSLALNAMWAAARMSVFEIPIVAIVLLVPGVVPLTLFGVERQPVIGAPFALSTVAVGLLAFVAADFTNYWSHRLRHSVPALWRLHEIHHSERAFGPLTARRQHVLDHYFARMCRILPFLIIGPDYLLGFVPWLVIRAAAGYYHHADTRLKPGFLSAVVTTPDVHRLHHSTLPEHHNCNFGGVLIIWDRIFGTFHPPVDEVVPVGLVDSSVPHEFDTDAPVYRVFLSQACAPFWPRARAAAMSEASGRSSA